MKTIVHLSDLHFGAVNDELLEPLTRTVNGLASDLVAVSGDLTMRARTAEFVAARAFLDRLTAPQIVVPGNHDIPLYNIFRRFFDPTAKYRRNITEDLQPAYSDDEIAVVGINTARSLTIKDGRINERQIARAQEQFIAAGRNAIKIVVTHHPFDLPKGHDDSDIVGRAGLAIKTLAACGADLFLAGHTHAMYVGNTAERYGTPEHSALVVQAGSATSTRHRGEPNSFNLIRTDDPQITIERFIWRPEANEFTSSVSEIFYREGNVWTPVQASADATRDSSSTQ